jgi:hypothetical protein
VSVPVLLDEIYCTILYHNLSYDFSVFDIVLKGWLVSLDQSASLLLALETHIYPW